MSGQAGGATAIRVVSEWRGQLTGVYAGAGTPTITFSPAKPFLLGERICVTVTTKATSQAGVAVNHTTSYKYSITGGSGNGVFTNSQGINVAYKVRAFVVADMNGDGRQDVVTATNSSTNIGSVNIHLGNGQGGFSSSQNIPVSAIPTAIALGDINNDGKLDFVTAFSKVATGVNNIGIQLANGSGSFTGKPDLLVGMTPLKVALKDINRDGNLDLLTISASTNAVSLRLGNGQGNFAAPITPLRAEIPVGANPIDLAVVDVNGDSYLDILAVSSSNTGGTVSVRLGDGWGNFTGTSAVSVGLSPSGMSIQDMNADGKVDLLLTGIVNSTNGARGRVVIRQGDGLGTFPSSTVTEVAHGPGRVVTGDFNADGRLDFATISSDGFTLPTTVSVRFADGAGGYSGVMDWPIGQVPTDVYPDLAVTDMTGDGIPDLLTAYNPYVPATNSYNTSSMYLNIRPGQGGQNFAGNVQVAVGQGSHYDSNNYLISDVNDITLADLNQDQKPDMLVSLVASTSIGVRLNNGAGGFVALPNVPLPLESYNRTVAAGDVNNDGFMDFVTANAGGPTYTTGMTASVRLGNGQGGFTGNKEIALGGNPYQVYLQDVNNDGNLDLLATIYYSPSIVIKLGDGQGNFSGGSTIQGVNNQVELEIVDLNNDGFLDIVAVDSQSGVLYRRFGDGTGNFTGNNAVSTNGVAVGTRSGDVNGDGNVDLVLAITQLNGTASQLVTYLGDGAGTLTRFRTSPTMEVYSNALQLADINGDGILDAVMGSLYSQLTAYVGNGTGGFTYQATIPVSEYVSRIMACDVNNDGAIDLLAAGYEYSSVSVRINGTQQVPLATTPMAASVFDNALLVVPNPAHYTVQLLNCIANSDIYLLDALGRRIKSYKTPTLDISGIAPGVYFVQNNHKVVRLIVE